MTIPYKAEVADLICGRLAAGMVLSKALEETSLLPYEYYRWRRENDEFRAQTESARNEASHAYLDLALIVADECPPERDAVALAKLKVDTLTKMASLVNPRRYGQKLELASDPDRPLVLRSMPHDAEL